MPYTTYGLLKGLRSHQISSPSVEIDVKTGRPNACNLCHLDKTLGWTSQQLALWYRQAKPKLTPDQESVSAIALLALRGDAGQRALAAWHMGWKPAIEISGNDWATPFLGQLLTDPYSAVRYVAQRSLKKIPGFQALSYDYLGSEEHRMRTQQAVFEQAGTQARQPLNKPQVLWGPTGRWQTNRVATLLKERDERPVELLE
jgi:hypothetical protein